MTPDQIEYEQMEAKLKIRELEIKERELKIRSQELEKTNINQHALSYPIIIAIWGAVIGIFAQLFSSYYTEGQKMQYSLIQKALDDPNKKQALRNLVFLSKSGLVSNRYLGDLRKITGSSDIAPTFPGAIIRDDVVKISEVKKILKDNGSYVGEIDDKDSPELRRSIAAFQMKKGAIPDGLVGGCTLRELWWLTKDFNPNSSDSPLPEKKQCQ